MKECKYCRSMYDDNLNACPNCGGNKIITAEDRAEEAGLRQKEIENREKAIEAPVRQRKTIIGVIAAVVVVVVAIVGIVSFNANKPLSNGMTQDQGDAVLAEGIAYYKSGEYEKAMECLMQLPSDSKQYEEAQEIINNSATEYKAAILEKADTYTQNGEYEVAVALLDQAMTLLPDDNEVSSVRNTVWGQFRESICMAALSEADAFISENNYVDAITVLTGAQDKIGTDDEIEAKLSICREKYKQQLFDSAKTAYYESGYEQAVSVLQGGKSVLGDDAELLQMIAAYTECAPIDFVSVADSCYFAGDSMSWELIDQLYNDATMDYFYNVACRHGTTKYELNGGYALLEGVFVYNGDRDSTSTMFYDYLNPKISIYGDDILLFSTTLSRDKRTEAFSVDLTGVNYLTIELSDTYQSYAFGVSHYCSGVSDFYIYKNVIR